MVYWVVLSLAAGNKWCSAGSILGLVLFNISNSDLEERMESTLIKFVDDAKGGPADMLKGQAAFCTLGEVELRGCK